MTPETPKEVFNKWCKGWVRTMMSIGIHPEAIYRFELSAKELETKLFKDEQVLDVIQDQQ